MPSSRTYPIPARLAEARKKAGLTQEKAAEQAGLSTTSIARYERALGYPSQAALKLLALLYGTSVEWLLGDGDGDAAPTDSDPPVAAPDPEQPDIEADREFVMNAASVALRAATPNLSDEAIRLIADYIRFVEEREERERREQEGR